MIREIRNFRKLYQNECNAGRILCIGLDPDKDQIPEILKRTSGRALTPAAIQFNFVKQIIDATHDICGAYKLQVSYYEALGAEGYINMGRIVRYLFQLCPEKALILDAKRGDTKRSNVGYATSAFDNVGFDAITLHPYMGGYLSMEPFLSRKNKGCIVVCRSSNEDGGEFQDRRVIAYKGEILELLREDFLDVWGSTGDKFTRERGWNSQLAHEDYCSIPFYEYVALRVAKHWNGNDNCGLVVGATYPEEAANIRFLVGDDMLLLSPGFGDQQADVRQAVRALRNSKGGGFIPSSSSGIIHASADANFAEVARERAMELSNQLNQYRLEA